MAHGRGRWLLLAAGVLAGVGVVAGWGPWQAARARSMLRDLRSSDRSVRRAGLDGIRYGFPLSAQAAAVFAEGLRDPQAEVREAAAHALCQLGTLSRAHVTELASVSENDESDSVRAASVAALGCIGPAARGAESRVRALLEYRPDGVDWVGSPRGWNVRAQAAFALGAMGGRSPETIAALKKLRKDPHKLVSDSAAEALTRLAVE